MVYRKLVVALPDDLYEWLEQAAEKSDRAPSQEARNIIRRSFERAAAGSQS